MTHSILGDLCQQYKPTAPTSKYAPIIYDLTTQLHEPVQSILSVLDRRANTLSKCADFNAALRDAKVMQQLSSSSAIGYLQEASIYSEQGKQRRVIDTCNQALGLVDKKDAHYATLQRIKEDAEQRQNTRIDFITKLPLDIVVTALIPLITNQYMMENKPHPHLYVCNAWLDRIVQCFGGFDYSVFRTGEFNAEKVSELVRFSQYTRTLYVDWEGEGTWLNDMLRDNDFSSLRHLHFGSKLKLNQWFVTYVYSPLYILDIPLGYSDPLGSILRSVGGTLTHFQANMEPMLLLPVSEIILVCPNLVSLDVQLPNDADFSTLPMSTWPKLTELSIFGAEEDISCDQIIGIWKRFPSLKKLCLHPCQDIESALVVTNHFPSMRRLELEINEMGIRLVFEDQGHHSEEPGVTNLSLSCNQMSIDNTYEHVTSLLQKHHKTLEHMEWDVDRSIHGMDLQDIKYPRLTTLFLHTSGWWIPRNAPMLEDLNVEANIIKSNPEVIRTIPPKLKKLSFGLPRNIGSSIKQSLSHLGRLSQLRQLDMNLYRPSNISHIFDTSTSLQHLQRLRLKLRDNLDFYEMDGFVEGLVKECPHLVCLEVDCDNALPTYFVDALKPLEHLKQLAIPIKSVADDGSLWKAIESITQLEQIRIYPRTAANLDDIRHLKKQRPDLHITLDEYFRHF